MVKRQRSYDIVIFKVSFLKDCYVAVPFRSEMNHNNGYKFRFSERSKRHKSGLDYSKMIIIKNTQYLGDSSTIDSDEYVEFIKNRDKIHKDIEKYILGYINHMNRSQILHVQQFNRLYLYSTLKYFHKELNLSCI